MVVFLDCDGVLNDHAWCHFGHRDTCGTNERSVRVLNAILDILGRDVVIHSTWVGKILNGHVTDQGFGWMLKTHGVICNVVGHVSEVPDRNIKDHRSSLIREWMDSHDVGDKYLWIDDADLSPLRQIRPHPSFGLEPRHIHEAKLIAESLRLE